MEIPHLMMSGRTPDVTLKFSIIAIERCTYSPEGTVLTVGGAKSFSTCIPCTRTEATLKKYILQYMQKMARRNYHVDGTGRNLDYFVRNRYEVKLQRVLGDGEVPFHGNRAVGDIVDGDDDAFKVRAYLINYPHHRGSRWPPLPQFGIQWVNSPFAV